MAFTVTLAQLRSRVRAYTDTTNAATPTDGTIDGMLNAALRDLYARMAEGGAEFLSTSTILTTAAGVATYDLPTDFWQLRSVIWRRGLRDVVPLFRFADRDRAELERETWSARSRYRLADVALGGTPTIELCPAPDASYTLRVGYIPDPPTITSVADLVCAPGMDEWIVLDCTVTLLALEETDTAVWERRQATTFASVVTPAVTMRDENRTLVISDEDADAGRW